MTQIPPLLKKLTAATGPAPFRKIGTPRQMGALAVSVVATALAIHASFGLGGSLAWFSPPYRWAVALGSAISWCGLLPSFHALLEPGVPISPWYRRTAWIGMAIMVLGFVVGMGQPRLGPQHQLAEGSCIILMGLVIAVVNIPLYKLSRRGYSTRPWLTALWTTALSLLAGTFVMAFGCHIADERHHFWFHFVPLFFYAAGVGTVSYRMALTRSRLK